MEVRLRPVRNDLRFIWVRHLPENLGQDDAHLRSCALDVKQSRIEKERLSYSPQRSTMGYSRANSLTWDPLCGLLRPRIERAGRKAQLAFAVRLPNCDPVVAQVRPWDNVPAE